MDINMNAQGQTNEIENPIVNTSANNENVAKRIKQWNRAIPEAGYITLGTIRYGVKLAKPKPISFTSSIDDSAVSTTDTVYNNDGSCNSSKTIDRKNCCCIGSSEIIMPWNSNFIRSKLPVSSNLIAKNRTLSSSSSSIATQRTSQPVGGCLVIGNRDSSPPATCCYTSSTKLPSIFNSSSSSSSSSQSIKSNNCDHSSNNNNNKKPYSFPPSISELKTIENCENSINIQSEFLNKNGKYVNIEDKTNNCSVKNDLKNLNKKNLSSSLSLPQSQKSSSLISSSSSLTAPAAVDEKLYVSSSVIVVGKIGAAIYSTAATTSTNAIQQKPTSVQCVGDIKINNNKVNKNGTNASIEITNINAKNHQKLLKRNDIKKILQNDSLINNSTNSNKSNSFCRYEHKIPSATNKNCNTNPIVKKLTPKVQKKQLKINCFKDYNSENCSYNTSNTNLSLTNTTPTITNTTTTITNTSTSNTDHQCCSDDDDISFIDSSVSHFSSTSDDVPPSSLSSVSVLVLNKAPTTNVVSENTSIKYINNNDDNDNKVENCNCHDIVLATNNNCVVKRSAGRIHKCAVLHKDNINNGKSVIQKPFSIATTASENGKYLFSNRNTCAIENTNFRQSTFGTNNNSSDLVSAVAWLQPKNIDFVADEEEDINFENKSIPLTYKRSGYRKITLDNTSKAFNNCFGKQQQNYNRLSSSGNNIPHTMEKRRNTLDRWQRLGFGRRTPSNSSDSKNAAKESKRANEKTERLKELTEMLKRTRTNPPSATAPPIPPPRKQRPFAEATSASCTSLNTIAKNDRLNDMERVCESIDEKIDELSGNSSFLFCTAPSNASFIEKQETPTIQLNNESECKGKSFESDTDPHTDINNDDTTNEQIITSNENEDDMFMALPKVESRTIIGAYTQKNIPYRSASFSQVDYSSGKYIRSAINAFKSNLKTKPPAVVDNTNLTLPRKRDMINQGPSLINCSDTTIEQCEQHDELEHNEHSTEEEPLQFGCEFLPNDMQKTTTIQEDIIEESEQELLHSEDVGVSKIHDEAKIIELNVVQASEMILDQLCEEEAAISASPNIDVFQTATTCLIPVPVYECVPNEWDPSDTPDLPEWINACEEEDATKTMEELEINFKQISNSDDTHKQSTNGQIETNVEIVDKTPDITDNKSLDNLPNDFDVLQTETTEEELINVPTVINDAQNEMTPAIQINEAIDEPTILVETLSEQIENIAIEIVTECEQLPVISVTPSNVTIVNLNEDNKSSTSSQLNVEIVEVRKRHSNDCKTEKISESASSSSDHSNDVQTTQNDDRRRIDKSKRRKGIYIQWPAIEKQQKNSETDDWESSHKHTISSSDSSVVIDPLWPCDKREEDASIVEHCTEIDLANCDFSSITTNVEKKLEKLGSGNIAWISCKTPDGSDTPASLSGSFEPTTPDSDTNRQIWPIKGNRKQSLTCQSSEEKDDGTAAGLQQNQQTYNKANKKAALLRHDSVSDNESDRTSPRERASQSPAPCDQDLKRYSKRPLRGPYGQMLEAEMKKPAKVHYDEILEELNRSESPTRSLAGQSLDETSRLPVPYHTRASSTPIRMDNSPKEIAAHKRYPSSVDSAGIKKELKNFCLDRISRKNVDTLIDNKPFLNNKKTVPITNESVGEKLQKRSLDESRLSQSVRNLSDKSLMLKSLGGSSPGIIPPPPLQKSTTSSIQATPALLAELLKGSSEKLLSEQLHGSGRNRVPLPTSDLPTAVLKCLDTRTHVVVELFNTEQSYVESLETVVLKYLNPLKSQENAGIVDVQIVDEIFLMVPSILNVHERFLDDLRRRLDAWDQYQKIGDAFVEVFSKSTVLETYTSFVNNWNKAKDAIRSTSSTRPAFARFLETMAREHKGKLSLDNLLIKPVQKFPNYELLLSRLIKHTDLDHPDQKPLQEAIKLVHDILLHLNCKEREALENDQRESALRELEGVIEGISELVTSDRNFLLFDLVSMPSGQAGRKDRGFFLFSDLLVITSIKRRSGTIRKPNTTCPGSVASTLDTNKYKFLMKIAIDDLEIVKAKDENVRKIIKEIENLSDDYNKLQQVFEIVSNLRCNHQSLEDSIKDLQRDVQRQLSDRQTNDSQLNLLELTLNTTNGVQHMAVVFSKPIKRTQWEQTFVEAKQKLAASLERHPVPEFLASIPIRKTRAGLQFTCAAPTLGNQKDVWVCNSDGYVGQVCVLSLTPEPTVTSCNGVCNARILCVASVPANLENVSSNRCVSISIEDTSSGRITNNHISTEIDINHGQHHHKAFIKSDADNIQLDSSSSSDDSDIENVDNTSSCVTSNQQQSSSETFAKSQSHQHSDSANFDDLDSQQSTMWLGTEDGCIHVYNCTDNIRIKKNKIKIQHVSAVYSILYLDNRVFVSLSNGEIVVYLREQNGWNTLSPLTISIGTVCSPVTRLINVHGKLWCSIQGIIKILNSTTLQVETQIQISSEAKPITNMAVSSNFVWISVQNSAYIKCFHSNSYDQLFEVNLAPPVNKMLSNCDDIIRQHKAACLRVTSLLACKDLVWVGTSAGVLLTISATQTNMAHAVSPIVTGIPYGHTGHVRFLTCVDYEKSDEASKVNTNWHTLPMKAKDSTNILIISGGDGYEDFRNSGVNPMSEVAGREDSTNHLLLWQV